MTSVYSAIAVKFIISTANKSEHKSSKVNDIRKLVSFLKQYSQLSIIVYTNLKRNSMVF